MCCVGEEEKLVVVIRATKRGGDPHWRAELIGLWFEDTVVTGFKNYYWNGCRREEAEARPKLHTGEAA
jgi:hypothetical protein